MGDKKMLIVPVELVRKIDENRGDMTQAEFIEFLIDSQIEEKIKERQFVTKEELRVFEQDIKSLLKSFLDFFVGYGLELGKKSPKTEFEELSSKLHELENELGPTSKKGEAKIKWK